tara:strand:- start:4688 stop:5617 length:930 start_codon:yes stop_codon:yes gene_type:complete
MMIEALSILIIGLILLLAGANILVTSTEYIKNHFSISGFFASFFMIGIATSAPEIFISIESALENNTILALGNSMGSNISNIALVFCISFFFIKKNSSNLTLPIGPFMSMILLTITLLLLVFFDGNFSLIDSITLIAILFISFYLFKPQNDFKTTISENKKGFLPTMAVFLIGLIMLIYGSDFFIDGATNIAMMFGVSSYVIGLTLTALGTSLPELAANIQSARKGHNDFIVGNIIGSNIFNIAIAASLAGIISSTNVDVNEFIRDFLMLSLVSLIFYFIINSNNNIIKTVYSATLVITYVLYIIFLLK